LELLEGIKNLRSHLYFAKIISGISFEVEESIFSGFAPFLKYEKCNGANALHEFFFYMVNFIEPSKEVFLPSWVENGIKENESVIRLLEKDFSILQSIRLHFGKDENGSQLRRLAQEETNQKEPC
jgi:hypothetical protein